ncbi:FMN-binding protein [uncultured Lutibacter sp.]|uniref:FMN-binding protein n=1 Tax=uncultured Lutibacter sp. TaxID=437739 RepID=UPI002617C8A9|nr:FMN-binding protein [uncultured Lutibacter sp.]
MKRIVFITILVLITSGFTVSKKIEILIAKEIKTVFNIEDYSKQVISVSKNLNETLPLKITETNFFKIESNNNLLGYYYVGQGYGKADYFDFIVIFDTNLIVSKVKVLIYREDHGGEIGSKRWLKQFTGKTIDNELKYQKDIAAISGATISAKAMTNEVNKLLKTIGILNNKKQL